MRLGEQTGVQAKARVNFAPVRASMSMLGVCISPQPYAPVAQAPWSSVMNMTTLGRRVAALAVCVRSENARKALREIIRLPGSGPV